MIGGSTLISSEDLSKSPDFATPGVRSFYKDGIRVIVRPSGTEPKLKCYIEVVDKVKATAQHRCAQIKKELTATLQK
jgi:phosphomannomutase